MDQIYIYLMDGIHYGISVILGLILLYLSNKFRTEFFQPGSLIEKDILFAIGQLKEIKKANRSLDLEAIENEVMISPGLKQCWDEYRDTLHAQKRATPQGTLQVTRYRSTSLANNFFTEQIIIATPIKSELYKHLPGILTGIGIIGTFFGLVAGLVSFDVSSDANQVRNSLRNLLSSVGNAFIVSLIAIMLAMIITWYEKKTINKIVSELDTLCILIDSLYEAGAGEEYLQRLVEAAETSATQSIQMKESLVTSLKEVLTELTNQQIAAITSSSSQMSQSIGSSITTGLAEPLEKISNAVQTVGNSQGEGVTKLLTDVMGRFVTEMDGMFGNQMRSMNDMMVQTANTIQTAAQRFDELANQIQQAGSGAADAMSKRIEEALLHMQASQTSANDQMRTFVDNLRENIAKGHLESSDAMVQMLNKIGETTTSLVSKLEEQTQKSSSEQEERRSKQEALTTELLENMKKNFAQTQNESASATAQLLGQLGEAAKNLVISLQDQGNQAQVEHSTRMADLVKEITALMNQSSEQVSKLTESVSLSNNAMRDSVNKLQTATNSNIERMGSGAEMLNGASVRLSENLNLVKKTSDGLGTNAIQLVEASSTLAGSLNSMQQVLLDQKSVRDALGVMVSELRITIENAKKDASMSSALVANLEKASSQLQKAQIDAGSYLKGVSEVLAEVHSVFATQLKATLNEGNKTFQNEIGQATSHLKGAIQDLGDVLDSIPGSK